jgi:hypothetical protein
MTIKLKSRAESRLHQGFALDRRYAFLMGLPQADKERTILEVAKIFDKAGVPYAIMGGVAVQIHTAEPRTTLDLDIALRSREDIPVKALLAAGFKHEGTFEFSDNWRAPGLLPRKQRTAVQFSSDDLTAAAVDHADVLTLDGVDIWVVSPRDLVILKLAAALEPRRRRSKRISDYGDIVRLLEEHLGLSIQFPDIEAKLSIVRSMI